MRYAPRTRSGPTFERCRSEALAAFGNDELYVEQLLPVARHIEVQIVGDGSGPVIHLGERECSVQRRYQKVIEVAPAIGLDTAIRSQLHDAAIRLTEQMSYRSLGTVEFLVGPTQAQGEQPVIAFIEANARLQVEHTVTEEVTGVDLVQTQLRLAGGASLDELGLTASNVAEPRGYAIQARVNMETMEADGTVRPGGGTLTAYDAPSGPGVRTDGFGYAGYTTSPAFDSLLAKVIAHSPANQPESAVKRTCRALSEFRIEGVATNIDFLLAVLRRPEFTAGTLHTRFVDDHLTELLDDGAVSRSRWVPTSNPVVATDSQGARPATSSRCRRPTRPIRP